MDDVLSAVGVDVVVARDGAVAEVVATAEEALEAGHDEGGEGEDAEGDEEVWQEVDGRKGGAVGEEAELEGLEEWVETLERGCEVVEERLQRGRWDAGEGSLEPVTLKVDGWWLVSCAGADQDLKMLVRRNVLRDASTWLSRVLRSGRRGCVLCD